MERLNIKDICILKDKMKSNMNFVFYDETMKVFDELLEYRESEEQGLLLRLKLKVGDEFWELNDNFLEPAIYPRKAHSLQHVLYCMDRLGKVTFLTKEEAEQKLAEMKGDAK